MEFKIDATSQGQEPVQSKAANSTNLNSCFYASWYSRTVKALDATIAKQQKNLTSLYLDWKQTIKKFGGLHGFSKFPIIFNRMSSSSQAIIVNLMKME